MKKQLICFCVISIIIVGSIIAFGMQFEQPDDYLIAGIVGGAFGYGENQILVAPYISSMLGLLMYTFNIITRIFNTYSVFLVIMYLLCIVNLHYFIYKQKKVGNGMCWFALVKYFFHIFSRILLYHIC